MGGRKVLRLPLKQRAMLSRSRLKTADFPDGQRVASRIHPASQCIARPLYGRA